jgi:hypothetical protein
MILEWLVANWIWCVGACALLSILATALFLACIVLGADMERAQNEGDV